MKSLVKTFAKIIPGKPMIEEPQLREMVQNREFKQVAEAFENGQVQKSAPVSDVIGYSYYQLKQYDEAISHLKKANSLAPENYYSNFFLAVCFEMLAKKEEAVAQFLLCLELHEGQSAEVLDHLLPLAVGLKSSTEREKVLGHAASLVGRLPSPNPHTVKLLFFQRRNSELTEDVLQGSLFCLFHSAKELAEQGICKFIPLKPDEKLRFVNLEDDSDTWVTTCSPYVAEVPEATILSGSSLVVVNNNQILCDILSHEKFGRYAEMQYDPRVSARRDDALLLKPFNVDTEIAEGIMLCGLASRAYGHWFAEFLPKLRFFEQHPRFQEIPIIIDEGMPESHYDFLDSLVDNKIYKLKAGEVLKVKNLLVAPADTFFPVDLIHNHEVPVEYQSNLTVGALDYIGKNIKKRFGEPENPSARLFLSRRSSTWRRLSNEQEIINELKKLNFETVYVEDYSFKDQVELFRSAECIVAPNGSALNNLIFSSPSVKVLALGQGSFFNWGGWVGSFRELGYSPQYLASQWLGDKGAKHLDYFIPADKIRKKVSKMLG